MRAISELKGSEFEYLFQTMTQPIVEKNNWLMISNIHLKSRTGFAQIDFIIFTPYGYYCIETKDWACRVICSDTTFWTVEYPSRKFQVLSPVLQNRAHYNNLNRFIPGYRINTVVCFSNNARLENSPSDVVNVDTFIDYLNLLFNKRKIITQEEMLKDYLTVMRESAECLLAEMEGRL